MKIFVVEDDDFYRKLLVRNLEKIPQYEIESFSNGRDFLKRLDENPDIVTLDFKLPDMNGHEVFQRIREYNKDINVIVVSGQEDVSTAVKLLHDGAYSYITKDISTRERLIHTIANIYKSHNLKEQVDNLSIEVGNKYDFAKSIIGKSSAICEMFSFLEKAIKVPNITVSITGETGTGKELIAKTIHYNSEKKNKPFVAVNMAAIPKELAESELFGHEKGAFTGAHQRKKGKFEEANSGTIFMDEIGEMDLDLQVKLLRVIQEKEITRVGGNAIIKTNTRIITATNKNLLEEVANGNFREDLYYRLLGLPINLPPLRERNNDIILLAHHFLKQFLKENNLDEIILSEEAKDKLMKYSFPGNVRELKAIIDLAAVLCNENVINANHINYNNTGALINFSNEELTLKEYVKRIINFYLQKYDNNVVLAAEKLGIGKSTIYNMINNNEL